MNIKKLGFVNLILLTLFTSCSLQERVAYRCDKLPEVTSVQKTLSEHTQVVNQIESVNPDSVDIRIDEIEDCLGKARIEITYATEQDRQEIEQMIGETFFGIPYRMQNI